MSENKRKRIGIVYSTNDDFVYQTDTLEEAETLPPAEQKLRVSIDRKQRKGKVVTLITGFVGKGEDIDNLARLLKTACGTGGSTKDGEIIIQGEQLEKIKKILIANGYTKTK